MGKITLNNEHHPAYRNAQAELFIGANSSVCANESGTPEVPFTCFNSDTSVFSSPGCCGCHEKNAGVMAGAGMLIRKNRTLAGCSRRVP
jgi:hypothetical protein